MTQADQASPDVREVCFHKYIPAQNSKGETVMVCNRCGDYRAKGPGHER